MGMKNTLRMAARNLYKTWTLHHLYPGRYKKLQKTMPVKQNKVVFLEVRMDHLTDSFTSVYDALEKEGTWELTPVFIREGMTGRKAVRELCMKAIGQLVDAKYIFVNDSSYFLSSLPLRKETKVIQLWHACGAFKRFGYSVSGKKFGADKKDLKRFPVHGNFSKVTVSSEEIRWAYAEAFHMENRKQDIAATGIARTDIFYDASRAEKAREKLKKNAPELFVNNPDAKIVLYAPTFRGRVADAVSPDVLDFSKLHEMLKDEYIFLCKHHPFVKHPPVILKEQESFVKDVTGCMEIDELLMISDVCITDYSSLIFEYALFERPMVFLAYDLADYGDWRGFYYPYDELTPGPIVKTTGEVGEYLSSLKDGYNPAPVKAFKEKYMGACDGHATERIIELMKQL